LSLPNCDRQLALGRRSFYLRTGKRLAKRTTEIMIQFAALRTWSSARKKIEPNRLILNIQPDEGISVSFGAKRPEPK